MKRIFLIFIAVLTILSCSKDMMRLNEHHVDVVSLSKSETLKAEFAKILSKAVTSEENLRIFIKNQALKKFDLDYDILYHNIKDMIVPGDNKTFRNIILEYCDDSSQLETIEKNLPLLTILVPDWSCFNCFSIDRWNTTSSEIAVGFEINAIEKPVYKNGKIIGYLKEKTIPDFPILIIKDNDRVKVSPTTKSSDNSIEYEFIDDVFNASLNPQTKVQHQYYDITIDGIPDVGNFVPENYVSAASINAYKILKDNSSAIHRDYIYFGITPNKPIGVANSRIKEYIHKLKFKNFPKGGFATDGDDFIAHDHIWDYKKNYGEKNAQELRDYFYYGGNLEIKLHIVIPHKDGSIFKTSKMINANFGDLFAIDHSDLDYRHRTWFCKDWYVYTINEDYIKPKWFIVDLDLPSWHIDSQADVISIYIEEIDPETELIKNISVKYTESKTTDISGNIEAGGNIKDVNLKGNIKVDHSKSNESERTESTEIKTTLMSDELGTAELEFVMPIISSEGIKNGQKGYYINTITTGTIDIMILPKEI